MTEIPGGFRPEISDIEPFDPLLVEVIGGKEELIVAKATQIITAAGVIQLPVGIDNPAVGHNIIIQSFSSAGEYVFNSVTEVVGNKNQHVIQYIGDRQFRIFYVMAETPRQRPVYLTFLNPVKSAIYRELLASTSSDDSSYTVQDFANDEFINASPEKIRQLLNLYLESSPRPDLAQAHYTLLTSPPTRIPGGGVVKKLF
jgi:hypothetical protein